MEHPAVEVQQLSVNYENMPVLWDLSFQVPLGKIVGIVGPNGAGKTTLIKAILGLTPSISGNIEFLGEPLEKVKQRVAYVPQRESVDWDFPITVLDLVLMGRYGRLGLFRWPRQADIAAAQHYLERVGMEKFADRQIGQLSGGQQQRVFLARALMQEADVYFLDEPFAGIDHATEKVIIELLHEMKKERKTIFVVHHDLSNVEQYFDWMLLLNLRLVACGDVNEVFTAENIKATYGKGFALLDEALKLSQQRTAGKRN